jgi:hypothetical protein
MVDVLSCDAGVIISTAVGIDLHLGSIHQFCLSNIFMPVTVAERSKASIVFARSEAGIVGSNPTQDMDV